MKKVGTRISHAVAAGWRFLMSQFFHSNDRMNVHDVRRCARFSLEVCISLSWRVI
ncbi:hypothetical protein JG687_00018120 [Phytophthora cactorum]|uniref:Uncharacterized protein n=1 Tax=Phytophthora cactorum TaxID=29920 RepID=A0A8T1TLB4_9STRA|nr:hypothetical protein JG687_00018120 [Phytophthora cactorum]